MFTIKLNQVDELINILCKIESINYLQQLIVHEKSIFITDEYDFAAKNTPQFLLDTQTEYIKTLKDKINDYFVSEKHASLPDINR